MPQSSVKTLIVKMSDNEEHELDQTGEDLKTRAKALQEREREYNSTLKQMENLTKDFATQFCEDAKAIFEKNLEIAEANV